MDSLSRDIINHYQGDFPLVKRPFATIAKQLGTDEINAIKNIKGLLSTKILSRFGPLYNADNLGGGLSLVAISVPEKDYSKVSEQINSLAQVAHNYRRDHSLNMWFVLATETPDEIQVCLHRIERMTGLKVYDFPKLQEYYLGLWLWLDNTGRVTTRSFDVTRQKNGYKLDDLDRSIIRASQAGLQLVPDPYDHIAKQTQSKVNTVLDRMQTMLDYGVIRRIGLVPNHYRLGLTSNGMSVWDVPDDRVDAVGRIIGQCDFVSHCYQRPRQENVWPYNLFAMLHGHDREEVMLKFDEISKLLGTECKQSEILFSSAILKKTGLRLVA